MGTKVGADSEHTQRRRTQAQLACLRRRIIAASRSSNAQEGVYDALDRSSVDLGTEQVLRVLGPPDYGRTAYFKARDELVWDWRACTYNVNIQRLYVLFDATAGTVRSTMSMDELFGHERITIPCVR